MGRFLALIRSVLGLASESAVVEPRRTAVAGAGVPPRRTITTDGFKVELDLTGQVLAIHAPIDREIPRGPGIERGRAEAPLSATLGTIDPTAPVSASVLAQKAKIFDDGLVAAVEVAAQEGAGRHTGKAGLLRSLGRAIAGVDPSEAGDIQELLLGAARLGDVVVPGVPASVESRVQSAVEKFLSDEVRSKPIGFYTWSRQLASIFQQDRMLQSELGGRAGIETLASALQADPSARAVYEGHLRLISRLTNPFAAPDLRGFLQARDQGTGDPPEKGIRFFPPSVGHETELIKKLYGSRPIPEGFVLVDELIRRIRSRALDLEPRAESGWYDYQTWALEALVIPERMPEGGRLQLDDEYRKLLRELFKGLLTLSRETHIKQLEFPPCGRMAGREVFIHIAPALAAEPLATFYLRRALGYRYVRGVLEDAFGPGQIERFHRLMPGGPAPTSLAEELTGIETLFLGAHVSVSQQLGLAPDAASGTTQAANAAAEQFTAWARAAHLDSDLSLDLRTMVPVFYDVQRRQTKVWVFLGWSSRPITVSFARTPEATIVDLGGKPARGRVSIRWGELHAQLPYPVTGELYVDQILDRNEFRRLCDACGTRTEIMRRLGASMDAA
jgi:hypothetical protein